MKKILSINTFIILNFTKLMKAGVSNDTEDDVLHDARCDFENEVKAGIDSAIKDGFNIFEDTFSIPAFAETTLQLKLWSKYFLMVVREYIAWGDYDSARDVFTFEYMNADRHTIDSEIATVFHIRRKKAQETEMRFKEAKHEEARQRTTWAFDKLCESVEEVK